MHVGDLIRQKRTELNMTQEQLGNLLGVNRAAINKWETGRVTNLKRETIKKLSEIFQISPALLVEPEQSSIPISPHIHPLPQMKQWKVLGGTACGQPIFKPLEDVSVFAPSNIDADYVFECTGDSMINARIFDGDIVFVKEEEVKDGQIGVVRIDDEYTLKRVYHGPDYLELRAENPMYPPIIIRGEQTNAEIVGRAVQFLSRVI